MSELLDVQPTTDSSSRNFRLLLISVFTDRLASYGLRSIVIIYAVFELNVESQNALYYYGYYMLVSSIASLIGGIISDFLAGPKRMMVFALSFCLFGAILSLIENPTSFLIAMGIVLIGMGFFRSSSVSFVGHITHYRKELLEKRFILFYGAISLGAFVSSIAIGLLGEYYGYFFALLAVCFLYAISLVIVSSLADIKTMSLPAQKNTETKVVPARSNIKFVVLASIGIAFFWFVFELYGGMRYDGSVSHSLSLFGFVLPKVSIYYISVLFSILLFLPYYYLAKKISLSLKLALGCLILGAIWVIWKTTLSSDEIHLGWSLVLVFSFFEGILDLLVTPTILTFMCRYSPKKYYGTLFGLYVVFCFLGIKLGVLLSKNKGASNTEILVSVVFIAVVAFFFLVPNELKVEKLEDATTADDPI